MRRLLVALRRSRSASSPATASAGLELGLQDDAYLSSADPRAWQLTRELRPDVIRYNVDWSSVARARPGPALDPGDPAYDWAATDGIVAERRAPGRARPADDRAGAGAGPTAAAHRARHRSTRATSARSAGRSRPATRAATCRPGAEAPLPRVTQLHRLERAQQGPVPPAAGPARPRGARRSWRVSMRACAGVDRGRRARTPQVALGPLASRGGQGGIAPIAFLARYRAAGGPRPGIVALNPYLGSLLPAYRAGRARGPRRDHGAQPRPARERAAGGLRRHRPDLADRVRVAHGAAARDRRDHPGAAGRARRAVGRPRARPLPVRADARLVPAARRLADELLAQRPGRLGQPQEARVRHLESPRARERCRDATVSGHARALDRHRHRRRHPAVAGVRVQPPRAAAQRGRAGLLGHRRAAQAPRRPDPEPGRDRQGLRGARERGLRAGRRGARAVARRTRRGAGRHRIGGHDCGPDGPLRHRRGLPRAARLGELPAAAGRAERHRGQDRRSAPLLQHHGAALQLAHPERADEHHRPSRRASASASSSASRTMPSARPWPSTCREPAGADPGESRPHRRSSCSSSCCSSPFFGGAVYFASIPHRHRDRRRRARLRPLLVLRRRPARGERRARQTRHQGRAAGARARRRERLDRRRPRPHAARLPDRRRRAERLRGGPQAVGLLRGGHDGPRGADGPARARSRHGARDLAHPQSRRAPDDARGGAGRA